MPSDLFFSQLGHDLGCGLGPNLVGLNEAQWDGFGPREKKNPFNKQAGFGPRVLARGSGSSMKKPNPNPIRCHSYLYSAICTRSDPIIYKQHSIMLHSKKQAMVENSDDC